MIPGIVAGYSVAAPVVPSILDDDPNYPLNSVLIHGNGTNGSTVIVDQLGNAWTPNGNVQITTTTPKFGTGAVLFDGSGDYLQTVRAGAVGTSDFTIEAWIRIDSLASDGEIFCIADPTFNVNNFNIVFEYKTTGALRGSIQDGSGGANLDITSSAGLLSTGTYYHVCFQATGTTGRLGINGVQVATATITGTRFNQQSSIRIGRLTSGFDRYFSGRIDDLRVSRVSRYTFPFTPPAAQLPSWLAPVFSARFTASGTNDAQGVAADGTHVWYSNSTTLFKYTTAGSLVTSRVVSGDNPTDKQQVNGMYLRSGVLSVSAAKFVAGVATSWVVDYDPTTLNYITHRQISSDKFSEGLAFHDGYWWVVFHADKVVCQYDTSWNLVDTHTLSFPITGSSGGYGPGTGYDGNAFIDNYFLANIHEIYDQEFLDVYLWDGLDFLEVARLGRMAPLATQGISLDPTDDSKLWYAERNPVGTDSFALALMT